MLVLALLAGCASEAGLTPAERELRAANQSLGVTVAEGAGLAALLGAGIGALASPRNRATGAAIGAGAGAVLGAGAGYLVARNNAARAGTEADYRALTAAAVQDAETYARSAAASRQVAAAARADAAALDSAWRARRITAATYADRLAKYERDNEVIRAQLSDAQQRAATMHADAAAAPPGAREQLEASAASITASRTELARSAELISAVLAARPATGT
jgi:hypothetical protein